MNLQETVFALTFIHLTFAEFSPFEQYPSFENPTKDDCEELLDQYANASATFTYCAIKFARPIRICERCVDLYLDVSRAHDQIIEIEDSKGNKICKEKLMNLDRLEVIYEGFQYISDLWTRASCTYCFSSLNASSIHLSNETTTFLEKLNNTIDCISSHSFENDTYDSRVCTDCEKMYCDLNHFYDNLKVSQKEICMDIVDSMNITRALWSGALSCVKYKPTMDIVLLSCSCIIAFMPILFYLSAWIFTANIRNRLQMQKRLAELLSPSTSADT